MENMALRMTTAFLDTKGIRYQITGEKDDILEIRFNCENVESIKVLVFFDEDNTSCGFRAYDFCKFPESKKEEMYKLCSSINCEYRWIKCYVDEEDNTVTIASDAIIQADNCGAVVYEIIGRIINIGDEIYPEFMRKIWA